MKGRWEEFQHSLPRSPEIHNDRAELGRGELTIQWALMLNEHTASRSLPQIRGRNNTLGGPPGKKGYTALSRAEYSSETGPVVLTAESGNGSLTEEQYNGSWWLMRLFGSRQGGGQMSLWPGAGAVSVRGTHKHQSERASKLGLLHFPYCLLTQACQSINTVPISSYR